MKSDFPRFTVQCSWLAQAGFALILCGCGLPAQQPESPPRTLELDGVAYRVEQITASTWTARGPAGTSGSSQTTAGLVRAIEKASNCKVTDSSYAAKSTALSAQVDCGSKLKD
ncbi:hypothetical protein [Polaromonas sp. A23]|uniref:hypothetical protein n=1 Tax=Polaromonas sp. A23 TaxID=1944133 RepID=UPI001115628D|nr:hypothetical protein [Polaromonas sp. A23]